ncbi:M73 family secreted endopeptidase [Methanonatronarchaeum thermophilum]|uniref:M73 family secreted endopeptidase n=1 Tax=Methanonatronarchaeum thermophilum TaxID=1927129 RepID=A0A1Y3GBZ0_9EURY|nr:TasA family protein [Methanonatronarchaeum thermophilum]OUJ18760.1 M73 family secreted endopeptidase [Methanonatronarchaeum thermophilum]
MFSKKALFSVLLIGFIAVAAGVGTYAYFTDVEQGDGVFQAGTIDISVNEMNPWVGNFIFSDMKPCKSLGYADLEIKNVGTNDARIFKLVEVTGYDTGITEFMCPYSGEYFSSAAEWKKEVTLYYDDGLVVDYEINRVDDIHNVTLYTITLDGEQKNVGELVDVGDTAVGLTVGDISGIYMYLGTLASGDTLSVDQSYKLHGDAGNEYQGDEFRFNIKFVALQTNDFESIQNYIDLENAEVVEEEPIETEPKIDFKLSIGELTSKSVELCIKNQGDKINEDAFVNITLKGEWGQAEHQKTISMFADGDLFEDQTACKTLNKTDFAIDMEHNLTKDLNQIKVEIMGVTNTITDFNQTTEEPIEEPIEKPVGDWNLTILDCNKTEAGFEIELKHDSETPLETQTPVNITIANGFEKTTQTTIANINEGDNWTGDQIKFDICKTAFNLNTEQFEEIQTITIEIQNVTSTYEFTVDETNGNGDNEESDENKTNGNGDNDSPGAPTTPTTPSGPSDIGLDLVGLNLGVEFKIALTDMDGEVVEFNCVDEFVSTAGVGNEYQVTLFVTCEDGEPLSGGLVWLLDGSGEYLTHSIVEDWSDSSDVGALELNETGVAQFVFTPNQPVEVSWLLGHEDSANDDKVIVENRCLVAENPGIEIIDEEKDLSSVVLDGELTHDLIVDLANKLKVSLVPADEREMALDDLKIVVTGDIIDETVYTATSLIDGVQTGLIEITPTGVGEKVAEIFVSDKDTMLSEIFEGTAVGQFNSIELMVITKDLELSVDKNDSFLVGEEIDFNVKIDGEPVEGALIYNNGNNATTNQDGVASLTFEEPGIYQIHVEKEFEFNNGVQTIYNEQSIEIEVEEEMMTALMIALPLLIALILLIFALVRRRKVKG